MHRVHLNELNRTRPHLNKRRIGSRSVSSSLCFPPPSSLPLRYYTLFAHNVVFHLSLLPFPEFPLSPRNGIHIHRSELDFERRVNVPSCICKLLNFSIFVAFVTRDRCSRTFITVIKGKRWSSEGNEKFYSPTTRNSILIWKIRGKWD